MSLKNKENGAQTICHNINSLLRLNLVLIVRAIIRKIPRNVGQTPDNTQKLILLVGESQRAYFFFSFRFKPCSIQQPRTKKLSICSSCGGVP